MNDTERHAEMTKALRAAELRIRRERFDQTQRAMIYLEDGLPLPVLLAALGISRSTWFRRVADLRERYSEERLSDGD